MATRNYADDDTKEVMDYVITQLDEHKFPEVFAALRTCPDTEDVIAKIMPGADPLAFWFAFKDLDERLRTRKDVSLEFIGYIQKQIEALIAAQQAAEEAPPAPTPPPAA